MQFSGPAVRAPSWDRSMPNRRELQDHKRLVIHWRGGSPMGLQVLHTSLHQLPRAMAMPGLEQPAQALLPVLGAICPDCLGEAVRIGHKAVTRREIDLGAGELLVVEHAYGQSRRMDRSYASSTHMQRRWVTAIA